MKFYQFNQPRPPNISLGNLGATMDIILNLNTFKCFRIIIMKPLIKEHADIDDYK